MQTHFGGSVKQLQSQHSMHYTKAQTTSAQVKLDEIKPEIIQHRLENREKCIYIDQAHLK